MPGMSNEDLARLLQTLIRLGTITEVNHGERVVRVQTGGLVTNWLKWHTARAGASKTWDPPSVGEQVILFAPGGDLAGALVMASLDSDQNPPPSTSPSVVVRTMPDGSEFAYDHGAGLLTVTGIRNMVIDAAESITMKAGNQIILDAPQSTASGKLTAKGLLSYLAGLAGENGDSGTTSINGDITHSGGKLESNGVIVHIHIHDGVMPGAGTSGEPVA